MLDAVTASFAGPGFVTCQNNGQVKGYRKGRSFSIDNKDVGDTVSGVGCLHFRPVPSIIWQRRGERSRASGAGSGERKITFAQLSEALERRWTVWFALVICGTGFSSHACRGSRVCGAIGPGEWRSLIGDICSSCGRPQGELKTAVLQRKGLSLHGNATGRKLLRWLVVVSHWQWPILSISDMVLSALMLS